MSTNEGGDAGDNDNDNNNNTNEDDGDDGDDDDDMIITRIDLALTGRIFALVKLSHSSGDRVSGIGMLNLFKSVVCVRYVCYVYVCDVRAVT